MEIKCSAFENNERIPAQYTCEGENISPELMIYDVPKSAKTLVLIVDDPDAPAGIWVHWLLWNISPETNKIPENSSLGVQGMNDFKKLGYGGPCPPPGPSHRYMFKLYALNRELDLKEGSTKQELEKAMEGNIVDMTELVGIYSR